MSETNDTGEQAGGRKQTLSLRRGGVEKGTVRQSFSHGRTKSVVVEKKKQRRVMVPGQDAPAPAAEPRRQPAAPAAEAPRRSPAQATEASAPTPASETPAAAAQSDAPAPTAAASAPAPAAESSAAPAPGADVGSDAPAETTARDQKPTADELAAQALNMSARPRIIGKAEVRTAPPAPAPASDDNPRRRSAHASTPGPRGAGARGEVRSERPEARGGRDRNAGAPSRTDRNDRNDRAGDRGGQRRQGGGQVHRTLSRAEQEARARALAMARSQESEQKLRAQEEAVREREAIDAAKRQLAEEELRKEREEARRQAEAELAARRAAKEAEEAANKAADASAATAETTETRSTRGAAPVRRKDALEEDEAASAKAKKARATPTKTATKGDDRRKTKLTITTALEDDTERGRSLAALRRRREKEKRGGSRSGPREKIMREVTIPDAISIQDLAARMSERGVDVIKLLMKEGQMHKITDIIDAETAELVVTEFGHTVKRVSEADVETGLFEERDIDTEHAVSRPPVVTIMGHVDHGKTSLLDAIRKANVVQGEAGGITQHIGAYQVEVEGGRVTFLDTPGHAAFTAMRARGAKATDIVILVVAADDGVMPQTQEAISHAKAAGVPMIVAINKIDKPGADPTRVRTDLLQYDVVVESLSGDVQDVEVSALTGKGLPELLNACLLQAEFLELKANPDREAQGVVVEAQLDKGRGAVATCLVQQGTLKVGDILVAGTEWGKVRALVTDQGERVKEAGPSMPVEVLGLNGTPEAGDQFVVVESEQRAREITEYRDRLKREASAAPSTAMSLEQMMTNLQAQGLSEFPIVLKADVQGSAEAIVGALEKLNTDEVAARILHQGVGAITESDVTLAAATGGIIVGFNVRANKQAREAAERAGVEIRYYSIIYNLIDDVKEAMSGMLAPERRETFIGYAQILQVFNITKVGKVAGCRVTEGIVERGSGVRLLRDNVVIHEGTLKTLKRFKDEVKDVQAGQECGMAFEKYEDIREGDVIECFRVEEVERTLA
ncbi:translation initiation factor IF-2 [Acuticoccus sp. I52.16.1]|uniref:translation initiation factor IF-2 n=1 Tax=Acuticoccus sp. I52.16.1 TaxID=2928472 RepID=UPI001FD3F1AD|nr:translation initiation factor IF-2 [Acuticoccus sp. I52.16.1]UOM34795.1 translation initiation factor IF-2 [Acuticoccus sp. I52.16.1]